MGYETMVENVFLARTIEELRFENALFTAITHPETTEANKKLTNIDTLRAALKRITELCATVNFERNSPLISAIRASNFPSLEKLCLVIRVLPDMPDALTLFNYLLHCALGNHRNLKLLRIVIVVDEQQTN